MLESTEAQFVSAAELRRQAALDKAAAAPPVPVVRGCVPEQPWQGSAGCVAVLAGRG